MSDQQGDDYPEKFAEEFGSDEPERSKWPIIIAGSIVVVLVAVVLIVALVSPPKDRVNDSTLVQYVVNDAFSARNSLNYDQYRGAFCERETQNPSFPTAEQFTDENRKANDADGPITIPKEGMDVEIQGDSAQVVVRWHRSRNDDTQTTNWTVVKQGDEWKVCNG